MNQAAKIAVLVTGMHRSGTSAITRILGILGCDLPQNLIDPHPSNERGFWESPDIVDINKDILVSAGTKLEEWRADEWRAFDPRWYDSPQTERFHDRAQAVIESQFGDSRLFVIKDPRICRLLPFWIETLARFDARPLIVSPIRNPLDVAESLEARDGIQLSIGCLMWLQHVLSAEAASRELTRAFLRYEQLLYEPHAVVDRLADTLGVSWPRRMSDADVEIDTFLSSGLRHHRNDDDRVLRNPRLSAWLRSSFEIFDRWAQGDVQPTDTAELNRIRTALDEAMPAFDRAVSVGLTTTRELAATREELDRRDDQIRTLTRTLAERDGYIEKLTGNLAQRDAQLAEREREIGALTGARAERDRRIDELNRTVAVILGSKSWRVTRPLRSVMRVLSGARGAKRPVRRTGRGPLSLVRKFLFHARTYGLGSACRHTGFFIATRMPGAKHRRVRNGPIASDAITPAPPVLDAPPPTTAPRPSASASPPATASAPGQEMFPPVAMLVQNLHEGGLERVVVDLTRQFVQQGIVAPVLVLGSGGRAATEAAGLGCDVRTFEGAAATLVATVQDLGVRVVLTHHCYEPLEQLSRAGVEIVEVIHNAYHWQRDQPYFANLRARCIGRFVAVSDFVSDYARSALLVPPDRLRVIENGLSRHGLIRPPLSGLSKRRKETVDSPVLAHLANAHPQKNHVALLLAFEALLQDHPAATLVLAGGIDASTDLGRRVQTEIETRKLNGRVRCAGSLDRRAVSHLLADAHVGLLPSGFEGFSIGSLEYAYFGLPTVLSDTGAARRLGDRYGHVVVADGVACPPGELTPARAERDGLDPDPATVNGIAAALRTVLADYDRFAGNAERAGLDWEAYSIEATARQYRELLQKTVAP